MSLPYFPMFPSDFEAKTSHLTLAEDGAYNRLLRICWMTPGCSIPCDENWIMRRVRAHSEDDKECVRAVLQEFFTVENGRYSNAKLNEVWKDAHDKHGKRVSAGSKGGKAKSLKTNKTGPSNAKAKLKQPEPEPEPDIGDTTYPLSSGDDAPPEPDQAFDLFNAQAEKSGWPLCQYRSKARISKIKARLKELGGLDGWMAVLEKASQSPHCCGDNKRGWTASIDFFLQPSSLAKLMEGNYDDRTPTSPRPPQGPKTRRDDEPPRSFAEIEARRRSRDFTEGGDGGGNFDNRRGEGQPSGGSQGGGNVVDLTAARRMPYSPYGAGQHHGTEKHGQHGFECPAWRNGA